MTFVLIDNALDDDGPCALFEAPRAIVRADDPGEVAGALARLGEALSREGAHAAGFFSYELGYVLEPRLAPFLPSRRRVPLLWFGLFNGPRLMTRSAADDWLAARARGKGRITPPRPSLSRRAHGRRFAAVMERIRAGDIYQLNLTFPARFTLEGCPVALYRALRARQRTAFGALIDTGELHALSLSPELFLARDGPRIETRPMKGTARRAPGPDADEAARQALARDPKCRAENLMIVDLMRNDLARVAQTGSVRVRALFSVETYPTLHQMTSTIEARLRPDVGLEDMLRALFPPGSVTGAPKIRAMELIRALEGAPRGVYTGAIGWMAPGGEGAQPRARFNVAIRTAIVWPDGSGEIGIGSGVVADSDARAEYEECLLKMRFMTPDRNKPDIQLIETLRLEPDGRYVLLERHLARLAASAAHFAFPFDAAEARAALDEEAARRLAKAARPDAAAAPAHMVRLLLAGDGRITVSSAPLALPSQDTPMRFVVSAHRVDPADDFLYHKTTRRALYDGEHARLTALLECDEVVFLNVRGELAEGSRTNIFLTLPGEEIMLTPALSCGLLPGTLRAEFLASGQAREAVLTLADLKRARVVWLGNSVRGLRRAEHVETPRTAQVQGSG